MKFDWREFTEEKYEKLIKNKPEGYLGVVHIGDVNIELINHPDIEILSFCYFALHEDTGYGETEDGIPYSYADGNDIEQKEYKELDYKEFKRVAEKYFNDYITGYNKEYSLKEHANRPLVIW